MNVHIRWMIQRDMPEVLDIEAESFEFPWRERDFVRCLRQRNVVSMVAECDDRVVGFMMYELIMGGKRINLLNFAVATDCRRDGVGAAMAGKLVRKLSAERRRRITVLVRETNLAAQQFFSACGFFAEAVLAGEFDETKEDAYRMVYVHQDVRTEYQPYNRIARFFGLMKTVRNQTTEGTEDTEGRTKDG